MVSQPNTLFTPEQYLALEVRAEEKSEYLDGEIFLMSGGSLAHRRIGTNILRRLSDQLDGTPCEAQPSELRVRTADSRLYCYPDAMVFCGGPKLDSKIGDTLLNPTVIFEVLSPSMESCDRGKKFSRYRTIETLQEYVLVSQDSVLVERFVRQADGQWLLSVMGDLSQSLAFSSIPATLKLNDIYAQIFPEPAGE